MTQPSDKRAETRVAEIKARHEMSYSESIKDKINDSLLDRDADAPIELTADEARWLLGVFEHDPDTLLARVADLEAEVKARGEILDKIQEAAGATWWHGAIDKLSDLTAQLRAAEARNVEFSQLYHDQLRATDEWRSSSSEARNAILSLWTALTGKELPLGHTPFESVVNESLDAVARLTAESTALRERAERAEGERDKALDEIADILIAANTGFMTCNSNDPEFGQYRVSIKTKTLEEGQRLHRMLLGLNENSKPTPGCLHAKKKYATPTAAAQEGE